ncbi:MAG: deoxyribonuclease IV [Calditrichaeota bacterium]|nr:deoxyribonuclease IV [Calditrichota bacterium]
MILGAHVSTSGGVSQAPLNARKLGITAIQIFSKNQSRWSAPPYTTAELDKWFRNYAECGITNAVAHDAYLINLCATDPANLAKSRAAFLDELQRADQLELSAVVMHPGSHLGAGIDAGLRAIAASLRMIFDKHPHGKARVLLETTAGQGTNLGFTFGQLAELIHLIDAPERVGICLDTCHIYAAGYDWTTPEGYERTLAAFDRIIGLNNLHAFHFNDTKKKLGSQVDRHDHIGEGLIGRDPFKLWLFDARFKDHPALLETPGEMDDFTRNLAVLKSLLNLYPFNPFNLL